MLTTTHASTRQERLRALFVLSAPIAIGVLVVVHAVRLGVPVVLVLCGLMIAVVGGCAKIGSP